jgi:hypothetical protein
MCNVFMGSEVYCLLFGDEYYGGVSGSGGCVLVSMEGGSLISWNSRFISIAYCSWINNCSLWKSWMYIFLVILICLPFLQFFIKFIVSCIGPYSCRLLKICRAYADLRVYIGVLIFGTKSALRYLRFSHRCCWRFKCGMWRRVGWWIVAEVPKDHNGTSSGSSNPRTVQYGGIAWWVLLFYVLPIYKEVP